MGRAPCCDKAKVKRGPWSPEEDTTLKNYVQRHGTGGNWIALPQKADETYNYDFSACLNTTLPLPLPLPSSMAAVGSGQNANHQLLVPDQVQFPPSGLAEVSEFGTSVTTSYSNSSSQEVSSLSGPYSLALDNSYIPWPWNGGVEDNGFLMDFIFGSPYDNFNGFGFQEPTSEVAPNLAIDTYTNLMANSFGT
ncbi:hypothetical protein HHK36_014207 [Tetracentron sinense]|uniref:Myb-like domain-containing protein n=1 Tax=Tetracentron sinense TaxID=13715 RepID=A0A834Z4N8_TETSI|nr:hypothetical protein HHK36_014207 [Tetracentron sinense]